MENIIHELINNEEILVVLVITGAILTISIVKALTAMVGRLASERTRREVAAYIAEGSMSPEQGEKLLASSNKNNSSCGCG